MSRHCVRVLPLALLILGALSALAPAPPKTYGPPIGAENAKKIAAVALAEAKKKSQR